MKTISTVVMASVIALSPAAFGVTPEAAKAGPIVPPGITARGDSFGSGFRDDEDFQGRHAGQGPVH